MGVWTSEPWPHFLSAFPSRADIGSGRRGGKRFEGLKWANCLHGSLLWTKNLVSHLIGINQSCCSIWLLSTGWLAWNCLTDHFVVPYKNATLKIIVFLLGKRRIRVVNSVNVEMQIYSLEEYVPLFRSYNVFPIFLWTVVRVTRTSGLYYFHITKFNKWLRPFLNSRSRAYSCTCVLGKRHQWWPKHCSNSKYARTRVLS